MRILFILLILLSGNAMANRFEKTFSDPKVAALAEAASRGNVAGVQRALQAGADPKTVGRLGFTVAHYALEAKTPEVLRLLLAAGADPISRREDGNTVPHDAASFDNDASFLEAVLDAGVDPNLVGGERDQALIMYAVLGRNQAAVRLLAKRGADLSYTDYSSGSALHLALVIPDFPLAKLLLELGTDPRLTTQFLPTAAEYYCKGARLKGKTIKVSDDLDRAFAEVDQAMSRYGVRFPCNRFGEPRK